MPPVRKAPQDRGVYVAKSVLHTTLDGVPTTIRKGERARAGHELISRYPELWERVEDDVMYEVEER